MKTTTRISVAVAFASLVAVGCGGNKAQVSPLTLAITPATIEVQAGASQQFSVQIIGSDNSAVTWSVDEGETGGSVTSSGLYTAPEQTGLFHVTATSQEDGAKKATALVTVIPADVDISVSITPSNITLGRNNTRTFSAVVTGTPNTNVTWKVEEGPVGGTVNAFGLYTAPDQGGTYHLVATSVADPSKSGSATITVLQNSRIGVTISPATIQLMPAITQKFTAIVTGTENTGIAWTIEEGSVGGTLTEDGEYTAPLIEGVFHVVATSVEDPSALAKATITVSETEPVILTLTPPTATVLPGLKQTFKATITGIADTRVAWSIQEGTAGGAITAGGIYTAPFVPGTYHVIATSRGDPNIFAVSTVTVPPPVISVTVAPTTATLPAGATQQLTATVTQTANTAVTWRVTPATAGGTVNATGLYTAPATPGTYTVTATSVADTTKSASATMNVVSAGPFSFSGTVSYPGTRSGPIIIRALDAQSNVVAGTTLATPGPFTVRGITGIGSFRVVAFMDSVGSREENGVGNPQGEASVSLAGLNVSGIAVGLVDPAPLTTARSVFGNQYTVGDGSAFLTWTIPVSNAREMATAYKVYWSQTPNPGPTNNVGQKTVNAGTNLTAITGLTNGTAYYIGISSMAGTVESLIGGASSPVTIGAPTGGSAVSGTVNFTGTLPPAPTVVVLVGKNTRYFTVAAPGPSPQAFSVPGVPPGTYSVYAYRDTNSDGSPTPGELVTLTTQKVTAPTSPSAPFVINFQNADASVKTIASNLLSDTVAVRHFVDFYVDELIKPIAKVALLSGPGITSPIDLPGFGGRFGFTVGMGSTVPVAGGTYRAEVTYADGTTATLSSNVTGAVTQYATMTYPTTTSTTTPTFTWTLPATLPAGMTQRVIVYEPELGTVIWDSGPLPIATRSIVYNNDGLADETTLFSGYPYIWWVQLEDANGNYGFKYLTFQVQ